MNRKKINKIYINSLRKKTGKMNSRKEKINLFFVFFRSNLIKCFAFLVKLESFGCQIAVQTSALVRAPLSSAPASNGEIFSRSFWRILSSSGAGVARCLLLTIKTKTLLMSDRQGAQFYKSILEGFRGFSFHFSKFTTETWRMKLTIGFETSKNRTQKIMFRIHEWLEVCQVRTFIHLTPTWTTPEDKCAQMAAIKWN